MIWRWYEDEMKMIWRWYEDDMKMKWRWYEDDMKMIWRWNEDDMKMIWRCLKMREVPRSVASSNSYASFVLSKLPKCFISQWTHSWRVNQLLREETEVARTVQSYEGEPRASNEDFDEDWQRRCFACSVQVKIRARNSTAFYSFALCAAKVPLGHCSRVSLV